MGKFAVGKKAYGISDRSGFRYRLNDMQKEWTGMLVGKDEFEVKQPQLNPRRKVIDPQALKDARPDRVEPTVVYAGLPLVTDPSLGPVTAFGQVGSVTITTAASFTSLIVTVSNPGSGNKYYIGGVQQATLTLNEGSTYRLDQSNGSNSSHPLRFSTISDGTHGGGSEYTTGVTTSGTPGNAGAYTQIIVASGAPTLYYYCTNHSGMGGQANTP